ncbi:GTP-binding protein EngA [Parasponia andersonii]|uniref:GTP-binding protein EngA n=1 Tax=Parasponia andersonii TaxID=3476 RepID=A0A2P5BY80_PARAD|nr:GTP-binding protein EngA [Parasponia andersonii]
MSPVLSSMLDFALELLECMKQGKRRLEKIIDVFGGKSILGSSRIYETSTNIQGPSQQISVTGIPVVFITAVEGKGRIAVMRQVIDTYEKWCFRLSTALLNRWLRKVMSRHSWKDQAAQPKVKYFTQVKSRPPTFVAFVSGKTRLSDTDIRFLTKSLKEDFDLGGIPIRIIQRTVETKVSGKPMQSGGKTADKILSDKRS